MNLRIALAKAIRSARKKKNLTQEDFGIVSSRTYLSTLERGLKSPTIDKLDEICNTMGVHPAAVVLAAYAAMDAPSVSEARFETIVSESKNLLAEIRNAQES